MLIDLKIRTRDFAVGVVELSRKLPNRMEGSVIAKQLVRCCTSVGAHFREGIRSRSNDEYIAKINAGVMELEETSYWLELVRMLFKDRDDVSKLQTEAHELTAIFVTLIKNRKKHPEKTEAVET